MISSPVGLQLVSELFHILLKLLTEQICPCPHLPLLKAQRLTFFRVKINFSKSVPFWSAYLMFDSLF